MADPSPMKKVLVVSLVVLILGGMVGADEGFNTRELQQRFSHNIRKYTLKNGLRVILMQNGTSPSLALYLKVGVGSANEPFDRAGTAHFLEHLLFKGTTRLGTIDYEREKPYLEQLIAEGERIDALERRLLDPLLGKEQRTQLQQELEILNRRFALWQKQAARFVISEEDSQIYSRAGQVGYNAYTSTDVTNYQIKLPKNRLELWAALESERFLNPVFREFYPERKVILEERRMRYDTKPSSLLYELYIKTAFGFSPYGKPVIGFESNILRMKHSETLEFFRNNYIPSRMVIAIVGDLNFDETFQIIERYFSRLPERAEPEFPPITLAPQRGKQIAWLEAKSTPQFITGWRRPAITHQDSVALEMLGRLLTDGQTSRLKKRLVLEEKIASSVSAYTALPGEKLESMFTVFCSVYSEEQYPLAEKMIAEELSKIATGEVSDKELLKIKNSYLAELIGSLTANAGLADNLSYYELMLGDYNHFFTSLDAIAKVTAQDLSRVAKTYFTDSGNTTVYMKPLHR